MQDRPYPSKILPKYGFWDADLSKPDVDRDLGLIIPRTLFATDEHNFETHIQILESLYAEETILITLQNTRKLISNKVCELVAKKYQVPIFYRYIHAGI